MPRHQQKYSFVANGTWGGTKAAWCVCEYRVFRMSGMKTWIPVRLLHEANVRTLCHSSQMHCFIFSALKTSAQVVMLLARIFHFRVVSYDDDAHNMLHFQMKIRKKVNMGKNFKSSREHRSTQVLLMLGDELCKAKWERYEVLPPWSYE